MNLNHYLPKQVVAYLHEREVELKKTSGDTELVLVPPEYHVKNGVVLFADVSGFTKMCKELTAEGDTLEEKKGTEKLAEELNKYMSKILGHVLHSGGDVLKFAGDAMIAVYMCTHSVKIEELEASIDEKANLCNIAIQTGLAIQQDSFITQYAFTPDFFPGTDVSQQERMILEGLQDFGIGYGIANSTVKQEMKLQVKVGIGLGRINIVHLGGESDNNAEHRYEYVPIGPALQQAYDAEGESDPGWVVTSRDVWKLVKEDFNKNSRNPRAWWAEERRPYNRVKLNSRRNTQFYKLDYNSKRKKNDLGNSPSPRSRIRAARNIPYESVSDKTLLNYVPLAVVPYLEEQNEGVNNSIESWGNELRRVTTLFIQLGLSADDILAITYSDTKALQRLQIVFRRLQECVYRYMGTINKFLIDDKGSTVIVVFGMPPFAHDNDVLRGVQCAKAILKSLTRENLKGHVGISTGVCFCGIVGKAGARREFSILRNCVNLASWLMSWAKEKNANAPLDEPSLYIDKFTRLGLTKEHVRAEFVRESVKLKTFGETKAYKYEPKMIPLKNVIQGVSKEGGMLFAIIQLKNTRISGDRNTKNKRSDTKNEKKTREFQHTTNLIHYTKTDTAGDLKKQALSKAGVKGDGLNMELYWQRSDPETAILPPILVNDNEVISNLLAYDTVEVLQFVIKENKNWAKKGMQQPPMIVTESGVNLFQPIIPPNIKKSINSNKHDTFSVIYVLEKLRDKQRVAKIGALKRNKKASRITSPQLEVIVMEGSYGVGRSYAINYVFNEKNKTVQDDIEVIRGHGNPFIPHGEEVCDVWKSILSQLFMNRCEWPPGKPLPVDLEKTVKNAFKKGYDSYRHHYQYLSGVDHTTVKYHEPDLAEGGKYIEGFLGTRMKDWSVSIPVICAKKDMDIIFGKDKSLNSFVQGASSGIASILIQASMFFQTPAVLEEGKKPVEHIVNLICALITGFSYHSDKPIVITIDHTEYLDPFSWLVLVELAEWWSFASVKIVLSVRNSCIGFERAQKPWEGSYKQSSIITASSFEDFASSEIIRHFQNIDNLQGNSETEDENSNLIKEESFGGVPFSRLSAPGRFMTMSVEDRTKLRQRKTHGNILSSRQAGEFDRESKVYRYLDRVGDRQILLNKLREMEHARFIHVKANKEYTKYIMSNILEVPMENLHQPLVDLLISKAAGMPLVIRDALLYYRQTRMIHVNTVHGSEHVLHVDEGIFENLKNVVPPAVEAICGMINDSLSITGVIALKIAAMIPQVTNRDYFTLGEIKKVFGNRLISTESMYESIDDEWDVVVASLTVVPVKRSRSQNKDDIKYMFSFGWIRDCFIKRLISKQRRDLEKMIQLYIRA